MKSTVVGLALGLATTVACALDPVTMEGCGQDRKQALARAFQQAIEFYSGSVIVNESQVKDNRLLSEQTLDYSAGRVERFNIVGERTQGQRTCITAVIWVDPNQIAHRILGHNSSEKEFSGLQHHGQIASADQEVLKGDQLLAHVMKDYPTRAYNVQQQTYTLVSTPGQKTILKLPYTISWNPNFLNAIGDTFNQLFQPLTLSSVGEAKDTAMGVVINKPTTGWFSDKLTWLVPRPSSAKIILETFYRDPAMLLVLTDQNNRAVHTSCWGTLNGNERRRPLYTYHQHNVRIYGHNSETGTIELQLPSELVSQLDQITNIQLKVVVEEECRRPR